METVKKKKDRIRKWFLSGLLMADLVFLSGCTGKELEQRRFPLALGVDSVQGQIRLSCAWPGEEGGETGELGGGKEEVKKEETGEMGKEQGEIRNTDGITQVFGITIWEAVDAVQALQEKYVDYSQVKAILWGSGLEKNPEQAQQVKDWLEKTPAFARNLLVFDEKRTGLDLETVQEQSKGQAGAYLENIYENQRTYRDAACMLQDLLYGEG